MWGFDLPRLDAWQHDSSHEHDVVPDGARVAVLSWTLAGAGRQLPVLVDSWLSHENRASIERVIIHVHGKERDAAEAWADIAAARALRPEPTKTLIVAPQFLNGLDKDRFCSNAHHPLVWKANNWGEGGASQSRRDRGGSSDVSSFEALDALVALFTHTAYPALQHLVVSGHSMGGQMVQRYAVLGRAHTAEQLRPDLRLAYVVMNPASYLYFSPDRPGPPVPDMDVYKYAGRGTDGLQRVDEALACYGLPPGTAREERAHTFATRTVLHFVHGEADTGTGDDRPQALAQGADRRERARHYHAHLEVMRARYAPDAARRWTVDWIAHVSHHARNMTTSPATLRRLFDPRSRG